MNKLYRPRSEVKPHIAQAGGPLKKGLTMLGKLRLALVAAAAFAAAAIGGSGQSLANPWNHGYGGQGYHGGPPPWVRQHAWRHRHGYGRPYFAPSRGAYRHRHHHWRGW
jgi:hypothetical protein